MLYAHWAHRKAILSFTEFIHSHAGLSSKSLVTDVRYICISLLSLDVQKVRTTFIELLV